MARALQPPRCHLSKTKIGLFVGAGTVARDDIALVPDHKHIAPGNADDDLCLQATEVTDRDFRTCSFSISSVPAPDSTMRPFSSR
jgi:hypothetical protein